MTYPQEHHKPTPTALLLKKWAHEANPVTKSVLAEIIGSRIDRALKDKEK